MTAPHVHLAGGLLPERHSKAAVTTTNPTTSSLDLRALHRDITQMIQGSKGRDDFLSSLVQLVQRLTDASVVAYFYAGSRTELSAGPRSIAPGREPYLDNADVLVEWAESARRQQSVILQRAAGGRTILVAPVATTDGQTEVLGAVLRLGTQSVEAFAVILQLAAGHVTLWDEHRRANDLDHEAAHAAAILELVGKTAQADGLVRAAEFLVNAVRSHLGCEQVALGTTRPGARCCRVQAISGGISFDPRSESARLFDAALTESLLRERPGAWPPGSDVDRHLLSAHERLSAACKDAAVYSFPLHNADGQPVGAWVFVGKQDTFAAEGERFIQASSEPVGACLDLVQRAGRGARFARWLDAARYRAWMRCWYFWFAATIAVGCLAIPLRYRIPCNCQIEPVTRRFVAAPHDGLFEKSLVKPGDVVRRDQVLGRLDGREVRWEMAGLAADEGRAAKSRDVSMAANKVAAAQIDALEMERLSHKRRLLEYRAVHLDIKSPIDGVIISGDLQRSEGIPVSIGQALYEIAPLGCMVAEIAIRDDDRSLVEPRQNVTIRLDAYPGKSWAGRLTRINPRAEERDDDNVFIGEVVLDSANGELRPGMKGRSVIDGPQYPLAWLLLRTPWNAVFRWMGW